jgi:hypothetical protein
MEKNIKTITINGVDYIRADEAPSIRITEIEGTPVGRYCIVRCRDAGVWAGVVKDAKDRNATVINGRRLFYFKAKEGLALSSVSIYGLSDGKIEAPVNIVFLSDVCEIIPCTEESEKSIKWFKEYEQD